jgi:hypothetical protein
LIQLKKMTEGMQKAKYITNKELLLEIHKSKATYCYYEEPKFARYDAIVLFDDITEENAEAIRTKLNNRPRRPRAAEPEPQIESLHDLVFRVMTYEHVPLCTDKKRRSRAAAGEGHLRVNFPPFKHYRIDEQGDIVEVGRSHWEGDLDTGDFCLDKGKMSNRLATMFMLLVERYSRRGNWRGYTYVDEMRSSALLQLAQVGLQFDESKGDNPFAFYTTTIQNCFTRVFNVERKNQNIRDDMLIIAGAKPSYTRQVEHELAQKFAAEGVTAAAPVKKVPAKRGRKPKAATTETPTEE